MTDDISALMPSHVDEPGRPPTDLRQVMRDLITIKDEEAASRRLIEKLMNFSSGEIDFHEVGQTTLNLLQPDGKRPRHKMHPQGMEVDTHTGLIYVTSVEIVEERDKARQYWGKGKAYLFECDIEGKTIRSINLESDTEHEYHPSGMVLIGDTMYLALSQYGPKTSSTIIKFNVKDWTYRKLFCIQDHIGLVIPHLDQGDILLGDWGSHYYYCTDLKGNIKSKRRTPCSDNLEHQDAQLLRINLTRDERGSERRAVILATGVTGGGMECFGLDIFDVASWRIDTSLRWPSARHVTNGGWPPFLNSTFLWLDPHDRILALVTDEQAENTMLVLYALTAGDA